MKMRRGWIFDGAQHERRDDGVEGGVGERQALRHRVHDLGRDGGARQPPPQAPPHRRIRLRQHEPADARAVVRQVRAGARAELEHVTLRLRQQRPAVGRQVPPLVGAAEAVVDGREDRVMRCQVP